MGTLSLEATLTSLFVHLLENCLPSKERIYLFMIYDYSLKKIHSFEELIGLYNLPRTDFLKYISLVQSIQNHLKAQLKQERDVLRVPTVFDQLQKAKQTNKLVYNILLNSEEVEGKTSEQKWNECFLD